MGNFRHQSLRTTERERDADRERQRDERDREGQERLRNVSAQRHLVLQMLSICTASYRIGMIGKGWRLPRLQAVRGIKIGTLLLI